VFLWWVTHVPRVSPAVPIISPGGTHDRQPIIGPTLRPELLRYPRRRRWPDAAASWFGTTPSRIMFHLLARLTPNLLVSDFIGQVKGGVVPGEP